MNHTDQQHQGEREEFLTFRLGAEEYAIDILQVQEIRAHEPVTRIANAPAFVKGVINLRGQIVPIVDMRVKLAMPPSEGGAPVTIILDIGGRIMGVVVDAVSDVIALLPSQIRPAPELGVELAARLIRGLAPIDDRMLILINIARLMTMEEQQQLQPA